MGVNVAVLLELYSRLNTAISSGGALESVRRVRIGAIEENRKGNDLPVINIQLVSGVENPDFPNKMRFDEMGIEVTLIHPKLLNATDNSFFSTEDSNGPLYVFEAMRNAIDKNTYGTIDNTFASSVAWDKGVSYSIEEDGDIYIMKLTLTLKTKNYTAGGR